MNKAIIFLLLALVLFATAQYYGGEDYQTFGDEFDGEDYYEDDAQITSSCARCKQNYFNARQSRIDQQNRCLNACGPVVRCRHNCLVYLGDVEYQFKRCMHECR